MIRGDNDVTKRDCDIITVDKNVIRDDDITKGLCDITRKFMM